MSNYEDHGTIHQTKDGVPWPKIYGGGVEVETGEVFTAQVLRYHHHNLIDFFHY